MKNFKLILQFAAIALLIVSCSDSYLDVNTDPNNPTTVDAKFILPVAQTYTATNQLANRYTNTLGNIMMANWSQSDGFSWYYDEFYYTVNSTFYARIFDYAYGNTLKQYHALSTLAGDNSVNYQAIGDIMKAHQFQILVDMYGDIPYFNALQRGGNPTPAYDDAQTIYDDLIVQLTAAIAKIDGASADALVPADDDVMFGGNMDDWKKFANTVKLRILVRQSAMASRAAYVADELAAISSDGFITADTNVNPGYLNEAGKQSPMYAAYGFTVTGETQNNQQATCASEYIITKLMDTNDPRIDYLYRLPADPINAPGHFGVEQGILNYPVDDSFEPEHVSLLGTGIVSASTQDAPIFLLAESLFLQAEAVQRGLMGGDAKALYEAGITASFASLGAPGAAGYYGQAMNNVGWDASTDKIEAIITQKSRALNGTNGGEAWIEFSRTGFPSDVPLSPLASTPNRPVRLSLPSSEVTSNPNIPSQPNEFTTKIFWAN